MKLPPLLVEINKNMRLYATLNGKHAGFFGLFQKRAFLTHLEAGNKYTTSIREMQAKVLGIPRHQSRKHTSSSCTTDGQTGTRRKVLTINLKSAILEAQIPSGLAPF
jgi:hypothetical protein